MPRRFLKRLPKLKIVLHTQQKIHLADKIMDTANGMLISVALTGYLVQKQISWGLFLTAVITFFFAVWYTMHLRRK